MLHMGKSLLVYWKCLKFTNICIEAYNIILTIIIWKVYYYRILSYKEMVGVDANVF